MTLLLAVCLLSDGKRPAQARKDKAWQERKTRCENEDCVHLVPEEAFNCVNNCTSQACYTEIYAAMPLEDGEIDIDRSRAFTSCLRREQQEIKVRCF